MAVTVPKTSHNLGNLLVVFDAAFCIKEENSARGAKVQFSSVQQPLGLNLNLNLSST